MQRRIMGDSGLSVSEIGLGTMNWGLEVDEDAARSQLQCFLSSEGTLVDTAASFADGRSEAILGSLIGDVVARQDLVLVSQGGLRRGRSDPRMDASRRGLLDSLDASLSRLGTDHLDLWLAPAPDEHVPVGEVLSALETAYTSGRVRYVGLANHAGWQLARAAALSAVPVTAHQCEYSLLNRRAEQDVIPASEAMRIGLMAWAPLGRGALTGKYRGRVPADSRAASDRWAPYVEPYLDGRPARVTDAVATAAQGLKISCAETAIRWLLHRPGVATAVIGARNAEQLGTILASDTSKLPEQITTVLDEVSEAD